MPDKLIHHPNFFFVGTVKGGTTSLHRYLHQHPQIYMSPVKEVNYFSANDIKEEDFSKDYRHDVNVNLETYLNSSMEDPIHIAHITKEEDYLKLFRFANGAKAIGEMSLSYLLYPSASQKIKATYPQAKILMMLRDPAERAFSQYVMNVKQGKTLAKDFIEEITNDDKVAVKGWGANHQYLFVGKYFEQVKRYYEMFPATKIKVFLYDDYKKDAAAVVKEMFEFLEVDTNINVDTKTRYNEGGMPKFQKLNYWLNQSGAISWAKRMLPKSLRAPFKKWMYSSDQTPKMTSEERKFLVDYYKNDILQLQNLIGRDLHQWLKY